MKMTFRLSLVAGMALLLASCAGSLKRAEELASQDEWVRAVAEYRKAYAESPNDIEFKSRLKQAELKAADFYYQRGARLAEQGNLDSAVVQFQQGLIAMPDHSKLLQAMNESLARKEANLLYQEGEILRTAGKTDDALRKFARAREISPEHKEANAAYTALRKEAQDKAEEGMALTSRTPVTLNFRQSDLKQAFEFLAKSFGINVIFDEAVKSVPVTLFAKDVTFEQGLNLLLTTTKTFSKRIGPNSVLIAQDSKEKRGQYEDHLVRTYQLNSAKAKETADHLKSLLAIKKITINEQLNFLVIRDTPEILRLAEKIIDNADRKPAEMILEVEILEVNRNKTEKLGLDFGGYQIGAKLGSFAASTPWSQVRGTTSVTLPAATFSFFKQDVDAKTLANPKIRVVSGKSAKIHIGERVPLRAATIQDSTGQVRTTYEYKEIGIRLLAEPTIHLDNSSSVKVGLEVSSLGSDLGTPTEPAFSIGTRNAETYMLLRDGETAILGGMIRDEERNSRVRVPGLGDIPVIGALFTSYGDKTDRTDVLLTITPRVVRSWEQTPLAAREFYSGSENVYSDKPLIPEIQAAGGAIRADVSASAAPGTAALQPVSAAGNAAGVSAPAAPISQYAAPGVKVGFSETTYEVVAGENVEIRLTAEGTTGLSQIPLEVLYNPQLLTFVRGERGTAPLAQFEVKPDAARGTVRFALGLEKGGSADGLPLAKLVMRGSKPGVSYLVYRSPTATAASGEPVNVQARASRIVVK
jgi:general secretion pathway protein D